MRVINLIGGPNTGKTTTALGLTYRMKLAGLRVEYVSEYAKDMVYESRDNIVADQPYMLAKQNRRLHRLRGECDYVVTDSPLFLSLVYDRTNSKALEHLVWDFWNSYENQTFYLPRNLAFLFHPEGRVQESHQECEAIDERIGLFLPLDTYILDRNQDYVSQIATQTFLA